MDLSLEEKGDEMRAAAVFAIAPVTVFPVSMLE